MLCRKLPAGSGASRALAIPVHDPTRSPFRKRARSIHFLYMVFQARAHYARSLQVAPPVSIPSYRPEDQFQERLNAERLKELFNRNDFQGLLDLALLLNHQASFNNSRAHWALLEAAKNMAAEFSLDKYEKMIEEVLNE